MPNFTYDGKKYNDPVSISENAAQRRPRSAGYQPAGGGWQQVGQQQNRGCLTIAEQVKQQQQMQQQQQFHMSVQMGGELLSLRPGVNDLYVRQFQDRQQSRIQMGDNDVAMLQPDANACRERLIRRVEQHMPERTCVLQQG